MKAQYQNYIGNNSHAVVENNTFNNILALQGLCERDTVRFLQNVVHDFCPMTVGRAALDLSAGRGVTAMTLAELGFSVAAFDMNRNSISILQKIALQQELNISFGMGGILQIEKLNKKFDLIHEADCLVQMPLAVERKAFLASVKNILADGGRFVMSVPVLTENFDPADSFESVRLDENYIMWRQTPACDVPGVVELEGKHWVAQKRLAPADVIRQEMMAAGFQILAEELIVHQGNNPGTLRLVLASTSGCWFF